MFACKSTAWFVCGVSGPLLCLSHLWNESCLGFLGISFRRHDAIAKSASHRPCGPSTRRHRRFGSGILRLAREVCKASKGLAYRPNLSVSSLGYMQAYLHLLSPSLGTSFTSFLQLSPPDLASQKLFGSEFNQPKFPHSLSSISFSLNFGSR